MTHATHLDVQNVILTFWHNTVGRPIYFDNPDGSKHAYEGRSGISPFVADSPRAVEEFVRTIKRYHHAIVVDNRTDRPSHHHCYGVMHDDADWCESRFEEGSMASYYENTEGLHRERRIAGLPKGAA